MIEAFWLPYFCVAAWIQLQDHLQHGFERKCSKLMSGPAENAASFTREEHKQTLLR